MVNTWFSVVTQATIRVGSLSLYVLAANQRPLTNSATDWWPSRYLNFRTVNKPYFRSLTSLQESGTNVR